LRISHDLPCGESPAVELPPVKIKLKKEELILEINRGKSGSLKLSITFRHQEGVGCLIYIPRRNLKRSTNSVIRYIWEKDLQLFNFS